MATKIADVFLSGASSDNGSQADINLSLGGFKSSTKLNNVVNIEQPTNITGVTINKASVKHNFKPVTGTLTSKGETVVNAGLDTPSGAAKWRPSGDGDEVLLLHGDGLKNSNNIIDSSDKNHTIILNGTPKHDIENSNFDGKSVDLDVGDQVSFAASTSFDLGTSGGSNDFTIDTYIKFHTVTAKGIFGTRNGANGWGLKLTATTIDLVVGGVTDTIAWVPNANEWYHIAIVRDNTTVTFFVDGIEIGTFTDRNMTNSTNPFVLGNGDQAGAADFDGKFRNFRIIKSAIWKLNFTPPAVEINDTANTSLLLHMNGVDQSTTFTDSSNKNHTVTANGNAQIDTAFSKFGGASGLFDGSGDFLSIPDSTDFDFGSGDFTIEAFVKISNARGDILSKWGANKSWIFNTIATGELQFAASVDGSANTILMVSTTNVSDNTWRHVAITREGNDWRMFVDGIQETTTNSATNIFTTTNTLQIGIRTGGSGVDFFTGNIDEVNIIKGVAKYTRNFTIPSLYTDTNQEILVLPSAAVASSSIIDDGNNNHTPTNTGTPLVDKDDSFTSSIKMVDTNSDFLSIPDSQNWIFGSDDFTLECFVKPNGSNIQTLICHWEPVGSNKNICVSITAAGLANFFASDDGLNTIFTVTGTTNINDNAWHHIRAVRFGNTQLLFVDGVKEGTDGAFSGTLIDVASSMLIGAFKPSNPAFFLNGNIEGVRIVRGVALSTTNFTPPTVPHPENTFINRVTFQAFNEAARETIVNDNINNVIIRSDDERSFIRVNTNYGQPESTLQDITVNDAIGVLSFDNTFTELSYTAPNDTVGVPVEITNDGIFEIRSNNNDLFLEVTVIKSSLPSVVKTDNLKITKGNNIQNLFDSLTLAEGTAGKTDYKCIFIENNSGVRLSGMGVYIEQESLNSSISYDVAIERPSNDVSGSVQTIVNETTAPTGLTFTKPTFDNPINIAQTNLAQNEMFAIWIRRTVPAATTIIDNNTLQLGLKYSF